MYVRDVPVTQNFNCIVQCNRCIWFVDKLITYNYILYQYVVARLVIVVLMVIGAVFPQTFHKFIDMQNLSVAQILIA